MEKKLQDNLFDECAEDFKELKSQFCKYVEKKLFDEIEFDYIEEVEVRDSNAKITDKKLFVGQIFKFDLKKKQISIEDYKNLQGGFSKVKNYGPFLFEDLGFDDNNDSLFFVKFISYLEHCGEEITQFYNYPKYVIANKDLLCTNCSKEISLNNLFVLWKIDNNHFSIETLKELESQIFFMFNETLDKLAIKNIVSKDLVERYFKLLNKLNEN